VAAFAPGQLDGAASGVYPRHVPLYDFQCRTCGHEFERLVRHDAVGPCPSCGGEALERLLSSFAVSSEEKTRAAASSSRRKAAATAARDNIAIERETEAHRREDH
jgi:putative FmdB family regulatory protein